MGDFYLYVGAQDIPETGGYSSHRFIVGVRDQTTLYIGAFPSPASVGEKKYIDVFIDEYSQTGAPRDFSADLLTEMLGGSSGGAMPGGFSFDLVLSGDAAETALPAVLAYAEVLKALKYDYYNFPVDTPYPGYFQNSNSLIGTLLARVGAVIDGDTGRWNAPGEHNRLSVPDYFETWYVPQRIEAQCFPAGVEILLADGGKKPIEDIVVGDEVAAFDIDTMGGRGELRPARVKRLFSSVTDTWVVLSNGLVVTPGHLFLTSYGDFRTIADVMRDNIDVIGADGVPERVSGEYIYFSTETSGMFEAGGRYTALSMGSIAAQPVYQQGWRTYNFEVERYHTYVAGNVRVHNQSVFTATGHDLTVGSIVPGSNGDPLFVNANGTLTNLRTLTTSAAPDPDFSQKKYIGVYGMEADGKFDANVTPAEQSDYASRGAFLRVVVPGNGEMVTLASGKKVPAGTLSYSTDGYVYRFNEDGTASRVEDPRAGVGGGGAGGGGSSGGYKVSAGDTLSEIAQRNGTTVGALMDANPGISNADKIYVGQTIKIPGSSSNSGSTGGGKSGGSSGGKAKPVLIDLDDDGIEIDDLTASNFFYDMAGDGKQHRTAWAGVGDGVLVRDDGNDGVINQHREVIFKEWDSTAKTDFEALRNVFDTNHDGLLSALDDDWALFKVLVTRADGSTELKTLSELGITSIGLTSNEHQVTLPDGSRIQGTANYTKADGSTGIVGDALLAYDPNGYVITETRSVDGAGVMTLVHRATNTDGSLASETTTVTSADGLSRTIRFDLDGDGVLDRVQTDTTVIHSDGSRTRTVENYDGSGSILKSAEVTLSSTDGDTVTVSRDLDGSGNYDEIETRVIDGNGGLTLTITRLNADGSTKSEVTTVTSVDGLSKTTQLELTGSGVVNATEIKVASVDGTGTRTEVVTSYAGSGVSTSNRIAQVTTTTSADGSAKTVATDLDGDGTVDLTTSSAIVRNADGSTTTTISQFNGDDSLRGRSVTDLSADGKIKSVAVDMDGNGTYERSAVETTVTSGDGSVVKTTVDTAANGTLLSKTTASWSGDGQSRSTEVDGDGDGVADLTDIVEVAGTSSVRTVSSYSSNGSVLLGRSVTTVGADGLTQLSEVDANGDGNADSSTLTTTVINGDGSSTLTSLARNGSGSIQIGKTVSTTSADGLSTTTAKYLGTQTSPYATQTDVTVENPDGSLTRTIISFAGTASVQVGKVVTIVSADRLTTTTSSYLGTNSLPEQVTSAVTASDGSVTTTSSSYTPNGATLTGKSVKVVSSDGLTTTTTLDADGNAVKDGTAVSATTLNTDGTTTATTTTYAGSATLSANKTGQVVIDKSANGLIVSTETDVDGNGTVDSVQVDTTVLNSDGSRTRTVVATNGSGSVQIGKSEATVSDDGLTATAATFLGDHTIADTTSSSVTVLGNDGSRTETVSTYSASAAPINRTVTSISGNGLARSVSTDLDGNGVNDIMLVQQENADGSTTTETETYSSAGVLLSSSTAITSGTGLSSVTNTDLDGNGTVDRSRNVSISLFEDGSRNEAVFNADGDAKSATYKNTSADGLSIFTGWDITGWGAPTSSRSDITTINADGSTTRVISTSEGAVLTDRTTVTLSADGNTSTSTRDVDGNGSTDQTVVSVKAANGTVSTSAMDGAVLSASGRSYGSVHGRYDTISANGLSHTVQFDANGNGLSELQTVTAKTLNTDGSVVETITNSNLSGGTAGAANPVYTVSLRDKAVITTSANGLVKTAEYDLTGAGTFQTNRTQTITLGSDGSETETLSNFTGGTLKSRYETTTSGDGLTTTKQWDLNGAGTYTQAAATTKALNSDGTTEETTTNTGAAGALLSEYLTTTSVDGRTVTIEKDLDANGSYEQKDVISTAARADGSVVETVARFEGLSLSYKVSSDTSADGLVTVVSRDSNGDGATDQTSLSQLHVDGSSTVTVTDFSGVGAVTSKTVTHTTLDGLEAITLRDLEGDGINDRQTIRTVKENADGSGSSVMQVFRISEKTANGTVIAVPAVLTHTVATAVSADGRTTTTTVDVDGDGTVDESSTSLNRIDGSVVTNVTANAAARGFQLSLVDARWSSALPTEYELVAATKRTTVAADGLNTLVEADYDGNGTFEHVENWATRIDGVQIANIVDKNASGVVISSGTQTVSADGQTVTLVRDLTNDGTIDRKETAVTRVDGSKIKTVVDYNSSGTVTQTVTITASSNGEQVTINGSSGNERLEGGSGDETLIGGAGADYLIGGGGTDTASYATATTGIEVYLGNSALNAGDAAGDTFESIESVVGSSFDDIIVARQTGFRAEYFKLASSVTSVNDVNWNATPNYISAEGSAYWDRENGAVYPGGPKDLVALRMAGEFSVTTSGTYTFYDRSDDGSRIYIDGVEIINNDGLHSPTTVSASVALSAGTHQIEIRYFENTGQALLKLEWQGPGMSRRVFEANATPVDIVVPGIKAEFFNLGTGVDKLSEVNWSSVPVRTEVWSALEKDFGTGRIYADGPSDRVAIRFSGQISVSSGGTYTFHGTSDDGLQIYVDGVRIVNNDGVHGTQTVSNTVSLTAGIHKVEVRYFERTSDADVKVEWEGPGLSKRVLATDAMSILVPPSPAAALWGGGGNDTLTGSLTGDVLWGQTGNDTLNGDKGDDRLVGGSGGDTLNGGDGIDMASYEDAGSAVTVNLGSGGANTGDAAGDTYTSIELILGSRFGDTLVAAAAVSATVDGGDGSDTITGSSAADYLYGGAGDDVLNGGGSADLLAGGVGNDTYIVNSESDEVVEDEGDGNDFVQSSVDYTLAVNVENLTLTGASDINGTGNDLGNIITGNGGNNFLSGGAGNDTLDGGGDTDVLYGGQGNDTYLIGSSGDYVYEAASEGDDEVRSSITYTLVANVERLTLTGTSAINGTGNSLANALVGNAANNALDGASGNDTIDGGAGADTLIGGIGDDTYIVDSTSDVVTEASGQGTDMVRSSVTGYTLAANVENLVLLGTEAINGTGNGGANVLTGNSGANTLDGGAGIDTMAGGLGDDTYVVDSASDTTTEGTNAGVDTVRTSLSYTLGGNIENLVLTGTSAVNGTGNGLYNTITGNDAANILRGEGGKDILVGASGADTLYGGTSDDTLLGGNDDDTLYGEDNGDTLDGGAGNDTLYGGGGNDIYVMGDGADTIIESAGWDLMTSTISRDLRNYAAIEMLTLLGSANIDAMGNDWSNTIIGNAGNNVLDGGGSTDTLQGGLGDDTYVLGGTNDVVIDTGGVDTITSTTNRSLADHSGIENLTLISGGNASATGNGNANVLTGNSGANLIDGQAGNDTLYGGSGTAADTLRGGAGNDTLYGEGGNDTLEGGDDIDILYGGDGHDTLKGGSGSDTLYGDAGNNTFFGEDGDDALYGGTGNDTLEGAAGNDTLTGGGGADTYVMGDGFDTIVEESGWDLMTSTISRDLRNYTSIEMLTLLGSANIDAMGNDWSNTIIGNDGNNVLDGSGSTDTLQGGLGDDTYVLGSANDVVIDTGGVDTITSTTNRSLADYSGIENLTLISGGNASATGDGNANVLTGNSGANLIDGQSGDDTLYGGTGMDTLLGGSGSDSLYGDVGNDTLNGGDDADVLHGGDNNDTLNGGSGSDTLYGEAGNNTLLGEDGDDALFGGTGNDTLDGGAGNDTLTGGGGADTYVMGDDFDTIIEESGWDLMTSTISRDLRNYAAIEKLTLLGDANIDAMGNDWSNTIIGNDGNNVLDGGGSTDTLQGGLGDDTYVLGGTNDVVIDTGGVDTITSTTNRSLADYSGIENLTLISGGNASATGDGNANVLTGNSGANLIDGQAGNDTLYGGSGTAADTLLGGDGNDILYGEGGNDTLIGGQGADSLYGGSGNDTFTFGATSDSASGAVDNVQDFTAGDRIKLSDIDADEATSGDQAFSLDADSSFSAGEIRQTVIGSDLLLELNVDADSTPEMSILIVGRTTNLTNSDFIF